ncbi:isochorismate synthase [Rhodoluna sp.]|uniref:isochorismate synthase n=1 Tax=Rhodoluna sp. TaxID=1969481 RepID=UPI0025E5171D|nr:isochorismate synthase [Rhodoluna sp.]
MALSLVTQELELADFDLLQHLPSDPLTFIRNGQGIVGWGEAVRLESSAVNGRIQDLAAQWQALVATAQVVDPIGLPGTGLIAFGTLAFSDASKTPSTLIVPKVVLGSRDGRVWLTTVDGVDAHDFWSKPATYAHNGATVFANGQVSPAQFKENVAAALEQIAAGQVEKIVLARDITATVAVDFDVRPSLVRLANQYPSCWVYSVDGMFGASPELLVRVSHGQVSARVLAGTAGRGTDPGVDQAIAAALADSEKNKNEHAFAVNSLVEALTPFCEHVDADANPFSLALPNLWHLASDVHGVLKQDSSVLDLAAALHPTAAVAGTPTAKALSAISKIEDIDRGRYAGPVGWIGADGDGEWAIALRGAQLEKMNKTQLDHSDASQASELIIRAFAGCGIVAGSTADAELEETELKFRPIRDALI